MSSWHLSPIFDSYPATFGLGGLMFALWLWGTLATQARPLRKWTLGGLRLILIGLLLLAALRPTLVTTELKPQRATLIFMLDMSKSMLVADTLNGQTRWDALRKTLDGVWPGVRDLHEQFDMKFYGFDAGLQALDYSPDGLKFTAPPEGMQTAIGACLAEALRQEAGKQVAGVFLLSDGAQQSRTPRDLPPQTAARDVAKEGTPLFTVVYGQSRAAGQGRDVAVMEAEADPTVYVKNRWTISGGVRIDGYVNQEVPVTLFWETAPGSGKMEQVGLSKIRATQDGSLVPVEFAYLPQAAGEFKVTLRAAEMPGELLKSNNELSTFVTVLKGGLNVLYLEGELRVEQRYLRRALDASPNVHVDYVFIDHYKTDKPIDLSARFQRGKYDVYILGDLDARVFRPEDLELLKTRIDEEAGLLTLGGFHSYWPGGYHLTPLKDVLPLKYAQIDNLSRQNLNEPPRANLHLPGPVTMRIAEPFGIQSPLMRLSDGTDAENAAAWAKLPPLDGANIFRELKDSAKVLAETPDRKPLLVGQEVGAAGRVLSFAGDSTWHWFSKGFDKEHRRFWRQAIFWLAHKTPDDPVWIEIAQRRYSPGGRVEFTAGARGSDVGPISGASFTAEVLRPDGSKRELVLVPKGDTATGAFVETSLDGDYSITVTAKKDGAALGVGKSRFIVHLIDLELANSAARPDLLASLATLTQAHGGRALTPEQLGDALDEVKNKPRQALVEREEKHTPWDTWPYLLVMIALMCVEWFLRKKWGLV